MLFRLTLLALSFLFASSLQAEISDQDLSTLKLVTDSKYVKVYVKPGYDLSKYNSFAIGSLDVSFDKKWLKHYNMERKALSDRLNDKDIEEISDRYAKAFRTTLLRTLKEDGRFNETDGQDHSSLKIETAIVDLQINAPDKLTATSKITLVKRAGQATLETKMYDAKTGELVIAIIDKKKTRDHVDIFRTNRVRNQFEFSNVYRKWAKTWLASLNQKA